MPYCLSHNPNWVYFYNVTDYLWKDYVIKNINGLINTDDIESELENATREDILLRAARIGWTFADNFSANWEADDKAERFLKRFINSWIPYVRSYDGTPSLASYMSYLLGMEIRIQQLWTNASSAWDKKPLKKLFLQDSNELPEDYLVSADGSDDPFTGTIEVADLYTQSQLNTNFPGWQTIDVDPVNGWYPTSHFDLYVDLEQVPKSDLQEKSAEEIITGIFYELADMDMVLRAIIYSYAFTQVVKISSGLFVVDRRLQSGWEIEPEYGNWTIDSNVTLIGTDVKYTGSKTNGINYYTSFATVAMLNPLILSFGYTAYRTWAGVIEALKSFDRTYTEINGFNFYPYDSSVPCLATLAAACEQLGITKSDGSQWTPGYVNGNAVCYLDGNSSVYSTIQRCALTPTYTYIFETDRVKYVPNDANGVETYYITYTQLANKLLSNIATSTLAELYVEEIAKTVLKPNTSDQIIKPDVVTTQFETNKVLSV